VPKQKPKQIDDTALRAAADYASCGNCGLSIGKNQKYIPVFNTRFGGYEFYHESYLGCYESTQRRNSRPRLVLNRWSRGLEEVLFGDGSNESFADKMDEVTE
jgi:hypothetical protein